MENIYSYILLFLLLWLGNYTFYLSTNHGLAPNARLQQFLRYLPAAIVAVLPLIITGSTVLQQAVLKNLAISILWALAYPLTYHLTYRKTSPDYDHQIDSAFAIYFFGILNGLAILLPSSIMVFIYVLSLLIPLFVIGYYIIYRHVIDTNGMLLIIQTNYNEILEFTRAYSIWKTIVSIMAIAAVTVCFAVIGYDFVSDPIETWMKCVIFVMIIAVGYYLFKPNHGIFSRIGIISLYREVREYANTNRKYSEIRQSRMKEIKTSCLHPLERPHTILLVIGESASRDFMSAFTSMEDDTTPWMKDLSEDKKHFLLFPNAYSCDIQTVPVLEKALTTFNQYDGGEFFSSTSIIDIAKSLGYKIHWYSNQGHLGSADTPITLVAETSDVAKWTNQQFGRKYYDEALIDFLKELNPEYNNLVVLHLKGSHFNYENRFPDLYRKFSENGIHDKIANYKNTLYYTDSVLHQVFDKLRNDLNLQGMVYCSDHGDVPDRHRQPNFGGFKDTRIPLAIWMGDDYLTKRPDRVAALRDNTAMYWTNDLLYDLLCGFLDVESPEYRENNSLASCTYKYELKDLTIMNGTVHISDDETMNKGLK